MRNGSKIMNGFFQHRDEHKYTRYRWNQQSGQLDQKSNLDYIICSDKKII